jgi:hypothetical protein
MQFEELRQSLPLRGVIYARMFPHNLNGLFLRAMFAFDQLFHPNGAITSISNWVQPYLLLLVSDLLLESIGIYRL